MLIQSAMLTIQKILGLEVELEQIHYDYNRGRISKEVKELALKQITEEMKGLIS